MLHSMSKISQCIQVMILITIMPVALMLLGLSVNSEKHSFAINTKATVDGTTGGTADFVATNDWQVVEPGQQIPPGLHVRMNIQTGKTEAKLIDKSAEASAEAKQNLPVLVDMQSSSIDGEKKVDKKEVSEEEAAAVQAASQRLQQALSSREVKDALKKIKAESVPDTDPAEAQKFRSYDELKADFAKLNANIKTDLEILKSLLAEWNTTSGSAACLAECQFRILGELEYHLRQIDNGQNFVQLGGLELLMSVVNGTSGTTTDSSGAVSANSTIVSAALRALAAGSQGNTPVQIAALQAGFLPVLLRRLEHSDDRQLRSLCVLALASLCRNFPHAQTVLLKSGGLSALRSAFLARDSDRARALRIVTLLADMTLEAAEAPAGTERRRQYDQIGAARMIAETGWCQMVPRLLPLGSEQSADANLSHDSVEKTVVAMATLADACDRYFARDVPAMAGLAQLSERYAGLAKAELAEEGSPGYFCQLRDRIVELRERLGRSLPAGKTEL